MNEADRCPDGTLSGSHDDAVWRRRWPRIFLTVLVLGYVSTSNHIRGESRTLTLADLATPKCFLIYGVNTGGWTTDYPVAMRRVDGKRQYFQQGGDGRILESSEPTLLPCSTPIASLNVGALIHDWGTYTANGSQQYPGGGQAIVRGLYFDAALGKLFASWSGTYTNLPSRLNTFAKLSFGSTTLSTDGCYAPPYSQPYTGLGILSIPASFVTAHLPPGRRLAWMGGITASATSGNNYGPGLIAFDPSTLSPNPCAPRTDYALGRGTTLAEYAGNPNGSTCSNGKHISGSRLGCRPSPTSMTPRPAYLSLVTSFYDLYTNDWDPYDGHGYYGDDTGWREDMYDDNGKSAMVVGLSTTIGYLKTTVISSTGPGNAVLASTDTHDGYHLNAGDAIVIQTCRPGADAGCCECDQLNHASDVIVDSVNTSTGGITFHVTDPSSCTTCNNAPVAGGIAYGGPIYPHATPGWMRSQLRLQLWDMAQFASVLRGSPVYSPMYNEEVSLFSLGVTTLGDPSAGRGVQAGFNSGNQQTVTSVIADSVDHAIVIFVKNAQIFEGTVPRSLGIVIPVNDRP